LCGVFNIIKQTVKSKTKMSVKISATDVKRLRDETGAGMMDCKKALEEANGDFDGAIEYLRKLGQKLNDKRADRETLEGVVIALTSADNTKGIVVRVGCETDFVAKNEDFINFVKSIATVALNNFPADKEALLNIKLTDITVGEALIEKTGVIGEKIELNSYGRIEAGYVIPYIHMGNKAGVTVGFNKNASGIDTTGKDIAMQIAAMHPIAVDKEHVDATVVEKEIEIAKEIARNEGKPEDLLEKIAMGKLNAFYKERTLLNQEFVKANNKETVKQILQALDKDLTVTGFVHFALG
jgi:elongation factor Ts